jgi:AcrR family transcriptional regulator
MSDIEISDAKQRVMETAEALFMKRGYNAVSLRDIADALGIRQASLYYHFPDGKEELYVAIAERAFDRHRQGINNALREAGPDLSAQLKAVGGWFITQPQVSLASIMHADMPALSETSARHLGTVAYDCLFEPLSQAFSESNQRGDTRHVNLNVLTGSFLAILDSLAFTGNRPGVPSKEAMIDDVVSVLLDGLRTGTHETKSDSLDDGVRHEEPAR